MTHLLEDWVREWVIIDDYGWHLKDGAPDDVREKFDKIVNGNGIIFDLK